MHIYEVKSTWLSETEARKFDGKKYEMNFFHNK